MAKIRDIRSLLPVCWKSRLAVGAEHMVHMDERSQLWASMLSIRPPTPGILFHTIPAGRESALVNVTVEIVSDEAEIHVELLHDFVARTRNGEVFVALRSALVPAESLVLRVAVQPEESTDTQWSDRYLLLIGPRTVSADPDADRPDGAFEIPFQGSLEREVNLAYPGLAQPMGVRPARLQESPTAYSDQVAIAALAINGREVVLDDAWMPATATLGVARDVASASFDRFRRKFGDLLRVAAVSPVGMPQDPGIALQKRERARHEIVGLLRHFTNGRSLEDRSPEDIWYGIVEPLHDWLRDHGEPGDIVDSGLKVEEAPAWGLIGTSEVLERATNFLGFLINRKVWL